MDAYLVLEAGWAFFGGRAVVFLYIHITFAFLFCLGDGAGRGGRYQNQTHIKAKDCLETPQLFII